MKTLSESRQQVTLSQQPFSAMKDFVIIVQSFGNSIMNELDSDMNNLGEPSSDPGIDPCGTRHTSMVNAEINGDSIHDNLDQIHSKLNPAQS